MAITEVGIERPPMIVARNRAGTYKLSKDAAKPPKRYSIPDIGNILADISRLIAYDIDLDILRQIIFHHLFHRSVDTVNNIYSIGLRLLPYQDHNAGYFIRTGIGVFVFPAVNNLHNI
mgnify:CR=1 FL=1